MDKLIDIQLPTYWTLWSHTIDNKDWSIESHSKITIIDTVSKFWRLFNNFHKLNYRSYNFYLMKENITPIWEDLKGNVHSTVKPLSLTTYLATLLIPPKDYTPRRMLIPFAGVGSEIIGAMLSGWECIIGIEKEDKYIQIAKKRVDFWKNKKRLYNVQKDIKSVVNKCKKLAISNTTNIENYIRGAKELSGLESVK